jgi:hypothetical protein
VWIIKLKSSFFFNKYDEKQTHNILTLILHPKYKSLILIWSFIGHEQGVAIVEEYDKRSLFRILLKFYHHFHRLLRGEISFLIEVKKIVMCIFLKWRWTSVNLQKSLSIGIKKIFSHVEMLIFVNNNWPNEVRVSCKSLFSLVKLIEFNVKLKEEL